MPKQPPVLFTKLYAQGVERIRKLAKGPSSAMALWLLMVEQASKTNALEASFETLADILELDRKTIMRAVAHLEVTGAIEVYRHKSGNTYVLNNEETWKDAEEHKNFAAFTARKLVGKDNQKLRDLVVRKARKAAAEANADATLTTDTRAADLFEPTH
jgi:hypothetical protein